MPCTNIIPNNMEIFSDSGGTARYARTFYPLSGTIKGTIIAFFGGAKQEGPDYSSVIKIWTKGWSTTGTWQLNADECKFVQEMRDLGWRIVMLDQTQYVEPDGSVLNEYWVEEYINHWNSKWPGKVFAIGHSAGSYLTALHIRHFREGTATSVYANGIFSFSFQVGNAGKKTDYTASDFTNRSTLFLSGSPAGEVADAYNKTRAVKNIACTSTSRQGWEAIDTGHNIFDKVCGTKRAPTNICHDWFDKYPNLPKPPLSSCPASIQGVTNPDGCN